MSALAVRAARSQIRPRRMPQAPGGAVPSVCLRTPLGLPFCVVSTEHHPIWRNR
jgi:hypothetical protein